MSLFKGNLPCTISIPAFAPAKEPPIPITTKVSTLSFLSLFASFLISLNSILL